MKAADYLAYISKVIHTTVVATVDDDGLPVTAAIDMMDIVGFASEIGVSSATVNTWESTSPDKCSRRPGRESFRKICDLLSEAGVSLDGIETDYDCFSDF